jgi:hypothetical protein
MNNSLKFLGEGHAPLRIYWGAPSPFPLGCPAPGYDTLSKGIIDF